MWFIPILACMLSFYSGCHSGNGSSSTSQSVVSEPTTLDDDTVSERMRELKEIAKQSDTVINDQMNKLLSKSLITNVVGIPNCGNTCYMNAIFQALVHSDLGRYTQVDFNDIYFAKNVDKNNSFFKIFYDFANNYRTSTTSISAQDLVNARAKFMPQFIAGAPGDAAEYLNVFLNQMVSELTPVGRKIYDPLPTKQELARFAFSQYSLKSGYVGDGYSALSNLFGGFFKNITGENNEERIRYDFFFSINLPLSTNNDRLTLEKLLEDFSKKDIIDENNFIQIAIYKAPKDLIINFKRFDFLGNKDDRKVDYPAQFKLDTEKDGQVNYELYSVVEHWGTLFGGHYLAHVQTNGNWYLADDKTITPATEAQALNNQNAIFLFYRKR